MSQPAMTRPVCGSVTLRSNSDSHSPAVRPWPVTGEEFSPDDASQGMQHLVALCKMNIKRLTLKKLACFHQHQINPNPSS